MQIEFIGPLGRVTGSCTWMHDEPNGWNFLVDCGVQQGEGNPELWNQGVSWPFKPAELKFVLLTHAHMDHCGLIPLLYKQGFKGRVICTAETAEIAKVMLADAVKLGTNYDIRDIDKIVWFEPKGKAVVGGILHAVDKDLFVNFYRTNHIVGAVAIGIFWGRVGSGEQKKIIFSGDIGTSLEDRENLPILRYMMHPHEFDYAVIESTYGGVIRTEEEKTPDFRWRQLTQICDHITAQNSTALLPTFSLGRAQDLLFDLHWVLNNNPSKYSKINLVLDSPTAIKLTSIILKALERTEIIGKEFSKVRPVWLGKQIFRWLELDDTDINQVDRAIDIIRMCLGASPKFPQYAALYGNRIAKAWQTRVNVISNHEKRLAITSDGPCIVVASSGSCDGGAVTHWLPQVITKETNLLYLTGYTASNTVAKQLAGLQRLPITERRRHRSKLNIESTSTEIPFRDITCQIGMLKGYSAHADQTGLISWLFWSFKGQDKMTAPRVFIQHGDDHERLALRQAIYQNAANRPVSIEIPTAQNYQFKL